MNIAEILSPLLRRKNTALLLIIAFMAVFYGLSNLVPQNQKTTLYFTVKTLQTQSPSLDPVESASKIAEAIAGWAKDPGFRNEILEESGVYVAHFKRKITARRQNRINVFISLSLWGEEIQHANTLAQATINVTKGYVDTILKSENSFPVTITDPRISHDIRSIPMVWFTTGALFISVVLTIVLVYLSESLRSKVSFYPQIQEIFPKAPVLRIPSMPGKHDSKLLEQFILTFTSPRLIGTFPIAGKYFSLAPIDAVDDDVDTPILLVKLGETTTHELENLRAIFGEEVGIIVFER